MTSCHCKAMACNLIGLEGTFQNLTLQFSVAKHYFQFYNLQSNIFNLKFSILK